MTRVACRGCSTGARVEQFQRSRRLPAERPTLREEFLKSPSFPEEMFGLCFGCLLGVTGLVCAIMATEAKRTTNHDEIRNWVEARGGRPSTVKGTGTGREDAGVLRIDFPGQGEDEKLEEISWDDFFEKFDESNLIFLYQDKTADGQVSRFGKFVHKDTAA